MRGTDRAAGAVAAITGIRNPIAGRARGARRGPPRDARRRVRGRTSPASPAWTPRPTTGSAPAPSASTQRGNTVGAVARDARGGVAAATSTGGTSGKHPGRVGDSPLIAAGTWADDATAAISCTGDGEAIIRIALAHEIDALMRHAGLDLDHGRRPRAAAARARSAPAA